MSRIVRPATKIKVVPREGELEITLNINITVDGQVTATADKAEAMVEEDEPKADFIPDFASGMKLNFGKREG